MSEVHDMPVRIAARWRMLPGTVYGLQERAMIGAVAVREAQAARALALAAWHALLEEALPPASGDAAESVARQLACAACAVQRQWRIAVSERLHVLPLGRAEEGEARFELALPAPQPRAAGLAMRWALAALHRMMAGTLDAAAAEALRRQARQWLEPYAERGMNRLLLLRAARRQGIPAQRIDANLIVFGTGSRSRWMNSSITDATPSLAVRAAKQKHVTASLLRNAGLPGGINQLVRSPDAAVGAARELGFPVVVKPADRDRGEGVAADLRDEAAVSAAYRVAALASPNVLVEKWFPGFTHRLGVSLGRVDRVARKVGGVIGDGTNDVAALVRLQQLTPAHREMTRLYGRLLLQVDDEALALLRQIGRDPQWVPAAGEFVRLRRRDNAATGGTNQELDPADARLVHPDNLRLAVDAARVLRLDVAGVDVIMEDIARSWLDTGALICEVNAQPQVPRDDLIEGMLRAVVGEGGGRVPAELFVVPERARAAVARALVRSGRFTGIAHAGGLHVAGRLVSAPFANGVAAGNALRLRRDVDRMACVLSAREVANFGLPLDRWDAVHFSPAEQFTGDEAAAVAIARRHLG